MLSLSTVAYADPTTAQTIGEYLTFNAFGTLGIVHSSYDKGDFTGTIAQPFGAGFSHNWPLTPDSDLGGQANLKLTEKLSGVVQVLARDDADGNFSPDIEWANLKYQITPDLAVRVGRTAIPSYQRADIQNVGYALPWVRIPLEITYTASATHSDGVDVLYRIKTGRVTQNLEAQYGSATEFLPGEAYTSVRANIAILADTLQMGDGSIRFAYQNAEHGFPASREQLASAGFDYEPGTWFVTGDSNYTHDTFFGDFLAWYLSGGVKLGKFSPYVLYSSLHAQSDGTSAMQALGNERTVAAGVRWDFANSFDAKLQLQQVTIETLDDTAAIANLQPDARVGDKANLISAAIDFVF
jgi:hypothetical protein